MGKVAGGLLMDDDCMDGWIAGEIGHGKKSFATSFSFVAEHCSLVVELKWYGTIIVSCLKLPPDWFP